MPARGPHYSASQRRRSWLVLAVLGLLLAVPTVQAQEMPVPVRVQVPLLVRIMSFDRNRMERRRPETVVGILYQSRYRTSATIAEEVRRAINALPPDGAVRSTYRAVSIDLDQVSDLRVALAGVQVLYVSPLRAVEVSRITQATRAAGITTLTGVPKYVEQGLAVGLALKAERPEIIVNLEAARAEGADFTAQLLKLARVLQGGSENP